MPAQLGWIDFSPEHRQRVAAVLDMLKEEGVVDELGVGVIRDALANQMFPGISTLQTRAKYFFIVPYVLMDYLNLSTREQAKRSPAEYLKRREFEIMWRLAEVHKDEKSSGVIGITKKKGQEIMRRPSEIYWNGLRLFGMIDHGGLGVSNFLNRCWRESGSLAAVDMGDDQGRDDHDVDYANTFRLHVAPDRRWERRLEDVVGLSLTKVEADQLRDHIREHRPQALMAAMLSSKALYNHLSETGSYRDFATTLPSTNALSTEQYRTIVRGHDFSELMYGAHIVYNAQLQRMKFGSDAYEDRWQEWLARLPDAMMDYKGFDVDYLSLLAGSRRYTIRFTRDWWEFVRSGAQSRTRRDTLVREQEFNNKHRKARLVHALLDDVFEGRWIGLERLDYRMRQGRRILHDIYNPVSG